MSGGGKRTAGGSVLCSSEWSYEIHIFEYFSVGKVFEYADIEKPEKGNF